MRVTRTELQAIMNSSLSFEDIGSEYILAHSGLSAGFDEKQKEHLQIFDAVDNPISIEKRNVLLYRAECHGTKRLSGVYHRGTNVIFRKENQIYVPQRSPDKDVYPSHLDFSVSEHVRPGESYICAAVRGAEEELNQEIDQAQLSEFLKVALHSELNDEQVTYFVLEYSGEVISHSDEIAEGRWYDISSLKHHGNFGKLKFRPDHRAAFELFLKSV